MSNDEERARREKLDLISFASLNEDFWLESSLFDSSIVTSLFHCLCEEINSIDIDMMTVSLVDFFSLTTINRVQRIFINRCHSILIHQQSSNRWENHPKSRKFSFERVHFDWIHYQSTVVIVTTLWSSVDENVELLMRIAVFIPLLILFLERKTSILDSIFFSVWDFFREHEHIKASVQVFHWIDYSCCGCTWNSIANTWTFVSKHLFIGPTSKDTVSARYISITHRTNVGVRKSKRTNFSLCVRFHRSLDLSWLSWSSRCSSTTCPFVQQNISSNSIDRLDSFL